MSKSPKKLTATAGDRRRPVESTDRHAAQTLHTIVHTLLQRQDTGTADALLRPIVPIDEWVSDPYYCGEDGLQLYTYWVDLLREVFEGQRQYNVVVLSGGIGTGKSTAGLFMMLRMLYELSCYRSAHRYLQLHMESGLIVFLYFSLSKFIAKRTGYKQFRELVDSIPYFREHFPTDPRSKDEIRFPRNVYFLYGTGAGDAIGSNLLCSLLDEANFFTDPTGNQRDYSVVAELHRAMVARQASRFLRQGVNKSLSIVVSSATFQSSYTEELRKRSYTDPTVLYRRARAWDIKEKGTYSEECFYVYCGDEKIDPFIITGTDDLATHFGHHSTAPTLRGAIAELPQEYRALVDTVPVDFLPQYQSNIIKALQDFSGHSTESTAMLFTNRTVFAESIDETLPEWFTRTSFTVETGSTAPSNSIAYYRTGVQPQQPQQPRYLHIDLGLTNDAAGIACCYRSGTTTETGVERAVYTYDFVLRIVPPQPPAKISIARIEEFVLYLRDTCGLVLGMVSYDNFQSAGSIQRLQEAGIPTRVQSVDRDDAAYLYYIECLYSKTVRHSLAAAQSIQAELYTLLHYREQRKVDHPSGASGRKDCMDAVVGALYNAAAAAPTVVPARDIEHFVAYNAPVVSQPRYFDEKPTYGY